MNNASWILFIKSVCSAVLSGFIIYVNAFEFQIWKDHGTIWSNKNCVIKGV